MRDPERTMSDLCRLTRWAARIIITCRVQGGASLSGRRGLQGTNPRRNASVAAGFVPPDTKDLGCLRQRSSWTGMHSPTRIPPPNGQLGAPILRRSTEGLRLLLDAYHYAVDVGHSVWDFAVEIETLRQAGWTNSEFRWLVCKSFVRHAIETTPASDETRSFRQPRHAPGLLFAGKTCFVLTEAGVPVRVARLGKPVRPARRTESRRGPERCQSPPQRSAAQMGPRAAGITCRGACRQAVQGPGGEPGAGSGGL